MDNQRFSAVCLVYEDFESALFGNLIDGFLRHAIGILRIRSTVGIQHLVIGNRSGICLRLRFFRLGSCRFGLTVRQILTPVSWLRLQRFEGGNRTNLNNPQIIRQGEARCRFRFFQIEVIVRRQVVERNDTVLVRDFLSAGRYLRRMLGFDNLKVLAQCCPQLKLGSCQRSVVFFSRLLHREIGGTTIVLDQIGARLGIFGSIDHDVGIVTLLSFTETGNDGSIIRRLKAGDAMRTAFAVSFGRRDKEIQLAGELLIVDFQLTFDFNEIESIAGQIIDGNL